MRYFFHLTDRHQMIDRVGAELADLDAARAEEAIRSAGEWLRDNADTVAENRAVRLDVSDEHRKVLTSIVVSVVDPAASMN